MAAKSKKEKGNYISEWFGHRVYPTVTPDAVAVEDQKAQRCPFLSMAKGAVEGCIKGAASKGVCTVSSVYDGVRQDWLVCPWRGLSPELLDSAARRLFGVPEGGPRIIIPAARLPDPAQQTDVTERLARGERVFIYFDARLTGELGLPKTDKSPKFSFDVTIFEIVSEKELPHIGRFGVLEIQTTDYHGSYEAALTNLMDGLRLHPNDFASSVQEHPDWLSRKVQSPNISNVFKRTFYQMMLKFQLGTHDMCAGCVLAIPASVWSSWQSHLAAAPLKAETDGTYSLFKPGQARPEQVPAWIYVFDVDTSAAGSPKPLRFDKIIATDAPSISYYALEVAPAEAITKVRAKDGLFGQAEKRLKGLWPKLAETITY